MQQRGETSPGSKEKLPAGDSEEGLCGGILHPLCLLTSQVRGWEKGLVSSMSEREQHSHFSVPSHGQLNGHISYFCRWVSEWTLSEQMGKKGMA